MVSENINVRVSGALREHLLSQTGAGGLYENTSEYIRDLIRKDVEAKQSEWDKVYKELEAGLLADESEFYPVTVENVIQRNMKRYKHNASDTL